jgi:hypothetical protein
LARAWAGAISGFVAPTFGTFASVMSTWIASKALWRLQQLTTQSPTAGWADVLMNKAQVTDADLEKSPFRERLIAAMVAAPAPDLLHREALDDVSIKPAPPCAAGPARRPVDGYAGKRVVVSLGSSVEDRPEAPEFFLFGGDFHAEDKTPHACPGRRMAEGVLLGLLVALVKQRNLKVFDGLPLNLTFG